jgi:hypothetical protein
VQYGNAGGTAANIHDSAILQTKHGIRCTWLVHEIGTSQPGRFKDIASGTNLNLRHTWWVTCSRMRQLSAQLALNPLPHLGQEVNSADEIYYQTITHHLGKLVLAC